MAVCRECGAPLLFARMQTGTSMPLNVGIDPVQGNIAARREGPRLVAGRVITAENPIQPGEVPYLAHWATCTKNRKKKTAASRTTTKKPDMPPALF